MYEVGMYKRVLVVVASVLALLAIIWIVQGNDFFMYKVFAPRYEAARREVFINTPSYVNGKRQFLARLHHEWENADAGHRESLCALARSEAATVDMNLMPAELRTWECAR